MIAAAALIAAAWAGLTPTELAVLVTVIGLVLGAELLNTAVEMVTDLLHPHTGPLAALVKDVSAAAVLTASVIAAAVGGFVVLPHVSVFSPASSRALAIILGLVCLAALLPGIIRDQRPSG